MAIKPLDGNDPNIYSTKVSVSPYSFVDDTQDFNEESPPPTYIPYDELAVTGPIEKEKIFEDLEFCNHGGLRCVNEEAMERQKGVFGTIVAQFTKNFFGGKGISHMSLPVKMFEARSTL